MKPEQLYLLSDFFLFLSHSLMILYEGCGWYLSLQSEERSRPGQESLDCQDTCGEWGALCVPIWGAGASVLVQRVVVLSQAAWPLNMGDSENEAERHKDGAVPITNLFCSQIHSPSFSTQVCIQRKMHFPNSG